MLRETENNNLPTPYTEEEQPFSESIKNITELDKNIKSKDITQKENMAFRLVTICTIVVIGLLAVDYIHTCITGETAKINDSIFDMVKYILTTALGYFFATSKKNT